MENRAIQKKVAEDVFQRLFLLPKKKLKWTSNIKITLNNEIKWCLFLTSIFWGVHVCCSFPCLFLRMKKEGCPNWDDENPELNPMILRGCIDQSKKRCTKNDAKSSSGDVARGHPFNSQATLMFVSTYCFAMSFFHMAFAFFCVFTLQVFVSRIFWHPKQPYLIWAIYSDHSRRLVTPKGSFKGILPKMAWSFRLRI